jgi:hypothetical protein
MTGPWFVHTAENYKDADTPFDLSNPTAKDELKTPIVNYCRPDTTLNEAVLLAPRLITAHDTTEYRWAEINEIWDTSSKCKNETTCAIQPANVRGACYCPSYYST